LIVCFATTIITSMGHCRATKKAKDILRYLRLLMQMNRLRN
jgi:hypothetical protein